MPVGPVGAGAQPRAAAARASMALDLVAGSGGEKFPSHSLYWPPSPLHILQAESQTGPGALDDPLVTVLH